MLNIRSKMIPFSQVAEILHQNFQIVHHQPNLSVWLALADCLAKGRKQGVIVNWHGGRGQGQRLQSPNEITEAFFCEALALGSKSWSNRRCGSKSWGNSIAVQNLGVTDIAVQNLGRIKSSMTHARSEAGHSCKRTH